MGKNGGEPELVVVRGDAAVHAPVLLGDGRTEVHQYVLVVELVGIDLRLVAEEHLGEVDRVHVVGSGAERLRDLDQRVVGKRPGLDDERVLAREPLGGVRLEVHRGVDEERAALVVVGNLADALAQHVEKRAQDVERLPGVAVLAGSDQLAAADLALLERLLAILHQRVGPHVVVGADHQRPERVHERVVAVSAVAGPEQVAHQTFEPLVAEPLVEMAEEALLLPGPHVEEIVVRAGLLEQRVVLLLRRGRGVVEHDHAHGVPVALEVLVVRFYGLPDVTQAISRDHEENVVVHTVSCCSQAVGERGAENQSKGGASGRSSETSELSAGSTSTRGRGRHSYVRPRERNSAENQVEKLMTGACAWGVPRCGAPQRCAGPDGASK